MSLLKIQFYILILLSWAFLTIASLEWGSNTESSVYGGSLVPCNIKDHSLTKPVLMEFWLELKLAWKITRHKWPLLFTYNSNRLIKQLTLDVRFQILFKKITYVLKRTNKWERYWLLMMESYRENRGTMIQTTSWNRQIVCGTEVNKTKQIYLVIMDLIISNMKDWWCNMISNTYKSSNWNSDKY